MQSRNLGERSMCLQAVVAAFAPRPLAQWAGFDVNATEASVTALLQARCNLVQSHRDPDEWVLQEGARIHTEEELCTMIGPDAVCALEAMRAGLVQLDAAGVRRHEELAKCPLDKAHLVVQVSLVRTDVCYTNVRQRLSSGMSLCNSVCNRCARVPARRCC
jgi:Protein of unknown function (DUF3591)